MKIGIPKETADRETRVAITPTIAKQLSSKGFEISIEKDAGKLSNFSDTDYSNAGATIVDGFGSHPTQVELGGVFSCFSLARVHYEFARITCSTASVE